MKGYEYSNIGASGYTVYAKDSSFLSIFPDRNDFLNYSFNKLTLFQSQGFFEPQNAKHDVRASAIGGSNLLPFSTYVLQNYMDSITLMARTTEGKSVEFHGAVFENAEPGIVYHSMGTNGASTVQFLRSNKFEKQIAALNADLVIVSFGTNDCYIPYSRFCSSCAKDRFRTIIYKLRKQNPDVAILITTPADHFYRRRYDNRNLWYLNKALFKLSAEENVALWDLYGIMGGERSILNWQRGGYARGDLIHFTKTGYHLQAQLLYQALINSYESRFN
jgi:lysophospholipase L1-like esterase